MRIEGRNIDLRSADIDDAEFILSLRLDSNLNKFISKTNSSLSDQMRWLKEYKKREEEKKEYYFIIESKDFQRCGTVRLYDFKHDSYCWGSWIIRKSEAPQYAVTESALLAHQFGFYTLGFKKVRSVIVKENERTTAFHLRFGFKTVNSDKFYTYVELSKDAFEETKKKYFKKGYFGRK